MLRADIDAAPSCCRSIQHFPDSEVVYYTPLYIMLSSPEPNAASRDAESRAADAAWTSALLQPILPPAKVLNGRWTVSS